MPLSALFAPRVGLKPIGELCRRQSISLQAGIDARSAWSREADCSHGRLRRHVTAVSQAVDQGESVSTALAATGDYFPPLVHELVKVGEQSGNLDHIFGQLADHYENQLTMRRNFFMAIAWPMIELGLAVVFIGLVIWFTATLRQITNMPKLDILGLGLAGTSGLMIYVVFWVGVAAAIWLVARAVSRGLVWSAPIQRLVMRLPKIGKALETLSLSRLAWSMHLTMNTSIPLRRAMALSLQSTRNARYADQIPAIDAEIAAGHSLHEAFSRAGGYPADFLDNLAVGEESGKVVESMGRLARQYMEQARAAIGMLTVVAGVAVYVFVGAMIVLMIFRVFGFYVGVLNNAASGKF